jgi:hypothetical protein
MKNFIISNWPTLAIVVAFLIYVVFLVVTKKWAQLRALAYKLMLEAEKAIVGTTQGQNRFNQVFIQIYSLLPAWFRLFVSVDSAKAKLQAWYIEIADYIDDGKVNGSVDKDFKEIVSDSTVIDQGNKAVAEARSVTVSQ